MTKSELIANLQSIYPELQKIHYKQIATEVSKRDAMLAKKIADEEGFVSLKTEGKVKKMKISDDELAHLFGEDKESNPKAPKSVRHSNLNNNKLSQTNPQPKAQLHTFTGMIIPGSPEIVSMDEDTIVVRCKSGDTLTFNSKTLKQVGAKNPRFANKISIS